LLWQAARPLLTASTIIDALGFCLRGLAQAEHAGGCRSQIDKVSQIAR
jgi:hypothetical protein